MLREVFTGDEELKGRVLVDQVIGAGFSGD